MNPLTSACRDEGHSGELGENAFRRATAFGISLLPVALAGFLFLSWGASLAVAALKYARPAAPSWTSGALLYLVLVGALAWALKKTGSASDRRVVFAMIGCSAVVKLGLIVFSMDLPLNTDQALFHFFVRQMADARLQGETLSRLSEIYDYPVWAGRALPVHYAVRRLAGDGDLLWIRLLNVGLSTLILLATYGFSRRLLPAGKGKWAVFLMLALPFQWFVVTDYSHHLFSSFYFLICIWCAWEMAFADPGLRRRLALSILAGICLLAMMWQRGVHLIAMGVWFALLLWAGTSGAGWKRWRRLFFGLAVLPLVLSLPLAARFDAWLNRHDVHRSNSILPAFVARGWCPESDGEYCGRYEQLDKATPRPEKRAAMFRLVASQIRENSRTVCIRFPAVKTAKLFLVGYASNFEESLAAIRSPFLAWARGMRLAGAPIFLGLAWWGCLGLAACPRLQARWLPVFLAPLLTWGAYVFFGETSPRYSIFCQPFLAILGAWALSDFEDKGRRAFSLPAVAWRGAAYRAAIILGGIALAMAVLIAGVRRIPPHRLYANMQENWSAAGEGSMEETVKPGAFRPFEARLCLPAGRLSAQAIWTLPPRPASAKTMSLYLLDAESGAGGGRLTIGAPAGAPLADFPLESLSKPRYVELEVPPDTEALAFTLTRREPARTSGALQFGYVAFTEKEQAE